MILNRSRLMSLFLTILGISLLSAFSEAAADGPRPVSMPTSASSRHSISQGLRTCRAPYKPGLW